MTSYTIDYAKMTPAQVSAYYEAGRRQQMLEMRRFFSRRARIAAGFISTSAKALRVSLSSGGQHTA